MELFKLFGSIGIKNQDANKAIDETTGRAESAFKKISQTLDNVGSTMSNWGGKMSTVFTAPMVAGVTAVVKSYADLEQNIGGTAAVFGQFASQVQKDAKVAYKNMGLSASDYMATANKMASLFQGSGVEQQKSLKLTSDAMQRASDVASVMGVDMSMAMESVTDAAKGQFEMMDNLGVAMNATTLEAYALEKGVNFKWETASNAEKAELAMQMFMDRTSQYAGNFRKEAEGSVAGSFDAMKSAFFNLIAGLGEKDADMKSLLGNMSETIQNFAKNVKVVIANIWNNLPLSPWQKWLLAAIAAAGPFLLVFGEIVSGVGMIINAFGTISSAFSALSAGFTAASTGGAAVSGVMGTIGGALGAITAPVWAVIAAIGALIAIFVGLYNTNEEFRAKAQAVWTEIQTVIGGAIQSVTDFVMSIFGGLVAWWNENQELIRSTASIVWEAISSHIMTVINLLSPFIQGAWESIKITISTVWEVIKTVVSTAINAVLGIIKAVMQVINGDWSGAWETIKQTVGGVWDGIKSTISTVIDGISSYISNTMGGIAGTVSGIWNGIKDTIGNAINGAKDIVAGAIDGIKGLFNFDWSLPSIKLPHFKVDGGEAPWGFGGKGKLPSVGIDWYAKGGILTKPTAFGMNGNNIMVGGEAGREAVLPLTQGNLAGIGKGIVEALGGQLGGGPITLNITVDARGDDADEIASKIEKALVRRIVR